MGAKSSIEWTESTWNPVTGCCKHCYAERIAERLQAMGQRNYKDGFKLTLQPHMLNLPLQWRKSQRIFVNSMSDLFQQEVPPAYILRVFEIMRSAHWHQFQILTKRSDNLRDLDHLIDWPANVWMGVSVENKDYVWRIEHLRQIHAQTKFLSIEPLLGPIGDLKLAGIDWVIVGGESGPKARPIERNWVVDIQRQCKQAGVPFFFKQWGGVNKKKTGRELDGRTYDEMPAPTTMALPYDHYLSSTMFNNACHVHQASLRH
jgi:protein gp37